LGLLCAFWVDRRDKRIHEARNVERLTDVPVMLDLPGNAFSQKSPLASSRSKTGQAFTELAHAIAATLGEGNHVLLVAGTAPGPGASLVASNLAATLARTHSEAILVCADLNHTVAPMIFGLGAGPGLAELVIGDASFKDVVYRGADISGLWVITPGEDISRAFYHFGRDTAQELLVQLRRRARYVVVEAQATDEGADTFALAEFADAALITVELERTSQPEAKEAIQRLHWLRTPVLGAVTTSAMSGRFRVSSPRPSHPRMASDRGEQERRAPYGASSPGNQDRGDVHAGSRDGHGDPVGRLPGS
jgi:Mrp family chromosome partitioning ATPase